MEKYVSTSKTSQPGGPEWQTNRVVILLLLPYYISHYCHPHIITPQMLWSVITTFGMCAELQWNVRLYLSGSDISLIPDQYSVLSRCEIPPNQSGYGGLQIEATVYQFFLSRELWKYHSSTHDETLWYEGGSISKVRRLKYYHRFREGPLLGLHKVGRTG